MTKIHGFLSVHRAIFGLICLFFLVFSFISVQKHNHFQTFAWDLAFFDELIWKVSQGIEPKSSFNNLHILGDHFQPIILLLAPIYWIKNDVRLLLIAHALIASLSVYPIYLLSQRILKHQLLSLSVSVSFLLFTGYQHAVFDGFHQSVFAPFFLGWLYYFLETNNKHGFWVAVIALLATKEEYTLLLAAIGIVIFLYYKRRFLGLVTSVVGLISFFVIIYAIIPFFQNGPYTHFGYGELGTSPIEVITTIITHPSLFIAQLILPAIKIDTLISTFFSFGFLPLMSPFHLIPIIQQIAIRFIDTFTIHRWTNLNHYAFPLSPLLAVATIYGLKQLILVGISKKFLCIYLLSFTILQNILYHGPFNSLFKPEFYESQTWEDDAYKLIRQVPKDAIVASQNSLLPHLAQRSKFYLLPEVGNADYVAVDLANGSNKYSPIDHKRTKSLITDFLNSNRYTLIWQSGDSLLLKKR